MEKKSNPTEKTEQRLELWEIK